MPPKPTKPRIAICNYPGVIEISGAIRSYSLTQGAHVNLDELVGHCGTGKDARPVTLEDALGDRIGLFTLPGEK